MANEQELTFESVVIQGDQITPGLLIWRRYQFPAFGVVEIFLDVNAHIHDHLATSPYLERGVAVAIPIVRKILERKPQYVATTRTWGTATDPGSA